METVHAGSPTKHPAQRLATIEAAGELKIPFTSGILVGIGETEDEQVDSLEALAALHARYGHLQEVILQNFVPHPRYYGARGRRHRRSGRARRGGGAMGTPPLGAREAALPADPRSLLASPGGGVPIAPASDAGLRATCRVGYPVSIEDIKRLIQECKRLMPDVGVQVPPNLSELGRSWSRRGPPTWVGCRRTGTTSRRSMRFPARIRCARSWRRRGMR